MTTPPHTAVGEKENIPVDLPGRTEPLKLRFSLRSRSYIYDRSDQGNLVKVVSRRKDWKAVFNILLKMKEVLNVLSKTV